MPLAGTRHVQAQHLYMQMESFIFLLQEGYFRIRQMNQLRKIHVQAGFRLLSSLSLGVTSDLPVETLLRCELGLLSCVLSDMSGWTLEFDE